VSCSPKALYSLLLLSRIEDTTELMQWESAFCNMGVATNSSQITDDIPKFGHDAVVSLLKRGVASNVSRLTLLFQVYSIKKFEEVFLAQ